VLEILCIQANILLKCLTIVSRSLRCVQIIEGIDLNIDVKDAPHLERLIIWTSSARDGLHRSLKIGHAPALSMLGYLEPARHVLEIGNTTIKVQTALLKFSVISVPQYYMSIKYEIWVHCRLG
jgi:hypothetical protein